MASEDTEQNHNKDKYHHGRVIQRWNVIHAYIFLFAVVTIIMEILRKV